MRGGSSTHSLPHGGTHAAIFEKVVVVWCRVVEGYDEKNEEHPRGTISGENEVTVCQ